MRDRWAKNLAQKEKDREAFNEVRQIVRDFRSTGDASGFPKLRLYLYSKRHDNSTSTFTIAGWGQEDMGLDAQEYERFKNAFKVTTAGRQDDWSLDIY